jgi:hypothetical protein
MRKAKLVDCNPRWGTAYGEATTRYLTFDCPEGHPGCWHTIPFTPTLDGGAVTSSRAIWQRVGDDFATLTLSPSIRRNVTKNPETGEIFDPCHMHVNIINGAFEFAGDSGPLVES